MRRTRMMTVCAAAVTAALSVGVVSVIPAHAETVVPNVTTKGLVLSETNGSEVTDLNDEGTSGTLVCVPGKQVYNIGYRGELDMAPVVAKWNELKEEGRKQVAALRPNWYAYDSTFNGLVVSANFTISFTIDTDVVDIDMARLADIEAWKQAYAEANAGNPFVEQMIIDESAGKGAQWDADSKTVTIHFKLKDGLTAGELDATYKDPAFKNLAINTLSGLLSVPVAKYENRVNSGNSAFNMTNAKVTGTFHMPRYTGGDWSLSLFIPLGLSAFFPIEFGQPASEPATIALDTTHTAKYSYEAPQGMQIPAEVAATLPAVEENLSDLGENWAKPASVKITKGAETEVWTFDKWVADEKPVWVNDPAVSTKDCFVRYVVGKWSVKKADEGPDGIFPFLPDTTPAPKRETAKGSGVTVEPKPIAVIPSVEPTQPQVQPSTSASAASAKTIPAKGTLAKTGADTGILAGLMVLLAGAGAIALRGRKSN